MSAAPVEGTSRTKYRIVAAQEPTRVMQVAVPLASLLLALVAGGLIMLAAGENPFTVYEAMFRGAFGSSYNRSEVLVKMIPLLLTGLGVSVAFRMRLWNIGAEGQFYLGAIFATWIALFALPDAPAIVVIPVMVMAGMLGGALWAAIPGALRAWMGVNETITTLMLNYVAIKISEYLVHGPWKNPQGFGFPGTKMFGPETYLWTWGTTRVHLGLVFGLVAAGVLWLVFRNTRWGYEIEVAGQSERVARYAGMATARNILIVLMLSGALAGLAGMAELTGIGHSLQRNLSPGYGYTAIIVAWLGRLHPAGIILVAYALAALMVGGDQIQMSLGLPGAIAPTLQGVILFCLLGGETMLRYRIERAPVESMAGGEA